MALSFSTATSPTQIYTIDGDQVVRHTNERVLGIPTELLSPGEDASFVSYDGTRVSARLYLPAPALGFEGKRPLVYYIHGGPQSQERPDFAWFSIPLIQYLTQAKSVPTPAAALAMASATPSRSITIGAGAIVWIMSMPLKF